MGDEIQAIKAGLLEVADIVVVNKGDRPGAQRTASQLRAMLVAVSKVGSAEGGTGSEERSAERPRPKRPDVLVTTALTGDGVPALIEALDRHRATARDGAGNPARLARAEAQVWSILGDRVRRTLLAGARRASAEAILTAVADHELDPFTAADRLLADLRG
jgi:LAO/AO transport system kinase